MSVTTIYYFSVILIYCFAAITFVILTVVPAPYGRHNRLNWGIQMPNKLAWVIMESPAVFIFMGTFFLGSNRSNVVALVLLLLWQFHYVYRTFVFPLRLRTSTKSMPMLIMLFGFVFNCINGFINAYYIAFLSQYTLRWLLEPSVIVGIIIFFIGFYIHCRSDAILIKLRCSNGEGYRIPTGFLFNWVCSPNYLGEMIQWLGFAISAWSLPALTFFVYTVANLTPRALRHLTWYYQQFDDYPLEKKH